MRCRQHHCHYKQQQANGRCQCCQCILGACQSFAWKVLSHPRSSRLGRWGQIQRQKLSDQSWQSWSREYFDHMASAWAFRCSNDSAAFRWTQQLVCMLAPAEQDSSCSWARFFHEPIPQPTSWSLPQSAAVCSGKKSVPPPSWLLVIGCHCLP